MTIKQISGIHPYNDLFYRSCFFNCFFPIVKLHDQEVAPYLLNDQFAYGLTEEGFLQIDWMSTHDPEKIMNLQGIQVEKITRCANLIEKVKQDVSLNRPVIVWVDPYVQRGRKEYLTKHSRHSILITGFHENQQIFHVLENRHLDNLSYEHQVLPYTDVQKGYDTFHDYFQPNDQFHSYAAFHFDSKKVSTELFAQKTAYFLRNMHGQLDAIEKGITALETFYEQFSQLNDIEKLVASFNQVINTKKVELYRLSLIKEDLPELMRWMERILAEWEKARHQAAKLLFSGDMSSRYQASIKASLEQIIHDEKNWLEALAIKCKRECGVS
ncbi:C39 family peptidase [Bacillus pumilus]|uniref:C39 family peptidase n=1 Tax=Bacillus pumilus TaxID=1408 RepID=UPI002111CCA1|nr:C39 family peptidase [Bacillus pumilus]UUD43334.1 C39 family peptidase [Bacillus pumilus]